MGSFIEKFKKSIYLKNLMTMSFGSLIAQLALIIVSPILTRIYSPEQLGIFTLVITIVAIFTPIINGRYDISIVTASNENEAYIIAKSGIIISFFMSIFIGLGIFFYNLINPNTFNSLGDLIYLVVPILIITGITNVLGSYNNRFQQYKLLASVNIIRNVSQAVMQVMFGLLKLGVIGLVLSQLLSFLFALKRQAKYALKDLNKFKDVKFIDIIRVIKKYKNQPLYSAPALLINSLSYSILIFLIEQLYGVREVGFYSMSYKILGLPIALITANVAQVFFKKACVEKESNGNFNNVFKKTSILLLVISLPVFGIFMFISEPIFEIIFGKSWGRAGIFVAILSPMFSIRFIVSALSLSLVIANKQKVELFLQSGFLTISVITFFIAKTYNLSIEYFLGIISWCYFANYLIVFFIMFQLSRRKVS